MAYLFITLGILLCISGIVLLSKKRIVTKPKEENPNSFEANKAKGDAFESFVVQQFDKKYFTLQEWRGDKYVNGNYPVSNHFPDLEVSYKWKDTEDHFALECKWRKNFYKGAIEWAKDYQLRNYEEYANKTKLAVFVIIGVGGSPDNPKDLFILPLNEILSERIEKKSLLPYRKKAESKFFWDFKKGVLK